MPVTNPGDAFQHGDIPSASTWENRFANIENNCASVTGAETLTNKTLTAPKIANGGHIADGNGNEQIELVTTASAVNNLKITNAATGNSPQVEASGADSVGLKIKAGVPVVVDKGDSGAGTVTCDLSTGNIFHITATGNFTLAFSNPTDGQKILIYIHQDGTGSRTVTWPTSTRWFNATGATNSTDDAPTLTTTADKSDIFSFIYETTETAGLYFGSVVGLNGATT